MPRRSLVLVVCLAAMLAVLLGGWLVRAPSVAAFRLQAAPLVRSLQFSARVATLSRVDVGSTLTGRILEVAVEQGAQLRRGDVLARLETDELRAALAQAQAGERQAAARLAGLRSTGRRAAQAAVAQADSVLAAAQADWQRTQSLVAKGFLSVARLDEARRATEVARAQQVAAQAQQAANAEQGSDLVQAEAQLALATAATAAARARLAQAVLTAPADARVLARLVEPGQIVQPGRALFSLALAGPRQLVAQVDERYLEQLQVGQPASVLADAFPDRRFAARVLSISPLVDAQRGAIEVKFSLLPDAPAFLREDMTLSVEVETARRDSALVVPVDALHGDPAADSAVVLVERDGRVEARTVRLGLRTLDAVEVLEGLRAGDTVLRAGSGGTLAAGSRVRPVIAAESAPPLAVPPGLRKGAHEDAGAAMSQAMGR
ncbi:efflux RND transporter periplasmic adaptor subunit [Accumulibacter sp.]|uniref:efflux RND transporter periplasmic adaptor subunit n=1 Tax=Accumulibacter sp. TaxID=2053492 RepID=UPI00260C7400|nr:efflux RND transporter periplasmic adaptor subunit [Accumulibacter sp.]